MKSEKYIIWDHTNNDWFKPTYPYGKSNETKEILFSQSGELFLHTNDGQSSTLVHIPFNPNSDEGNIYTPCPYSGQKDVHGKKLYCGDIITILNDDSGAQFEIINVDGLYIARFISKTGVNDKRNLHFLIRACEIVKIGHRFELKQL